jgi:hypothetical protein
VYNNKNENTPQIRSNIYMAFCIISLSKVIWYPNNEMNLLYPIAIAKLQENQVKEFWNSSGVQ